MITPTSEPTLEPTQEPTTEPTQQEPTALPSMAPIISSNTNPIKGTTSNRFSKSDIIAASVVGGGFFLFAMIFSCRFYVRKKHGLRGDKMMSNNRVEDPDTFDDSESKEEVIDLSVNPSNLLPDSQPIHLNDGDNVEDDVEAASRDTFDDSPESNEDVILSLPTSRYPNPEPSISTSTGHLYYGDQDDDDEERGNSSRLSSAQESLISFADDGEKKENDEMDPFILDDDESISVQSMLTGLGTRGTLAFETDTFIRNNSSWKGSSSSTPPEAGDTNLDEDLDSFSLSGHISKFKNDRFYYWVGTDIRHPEEQSSIHICRSRTAGSSTWELIKTIDVSQNCKTSQGNFQGNKDYTLLHCSTMDYYVIYCKGIRMYRSTSNWIDGDWIEVKDNQITVHKLLGGYKDIIPSNFIVEGVSAFTKGSRQAFLIVYMKKLCLKEEEQEDPESTHVLIVRMKQNFLEVMENPEHRVVFFERLENSHRESFWLFKRRGTYYMTYSGPNAGEGSDCYYRTSLELKGPWSKEQTVQFVSSAPTQDIDTTQEKNLRAFASQHRYIMKINDQWVYAGDRLNHNEETSNDGYDNIIVPVKWRPSIGKPDQPIVTWKKEWDIVHYDGSGPDTLSFYEG